MGPRNVTTGGMCCGGEIGSDGIWATDHEVKHSRLSPTYFSGRAWDRGYMTHLSCKYHDECEAT